MIRFVRILRQRLRSLLRRSKAETDLQQELDLHIAQLVKENMAAGLAEAEAFAAARREFGSMAVLKEECRDMRRTNMVEDLVRDVSFALRALRKSPVFTVAALLSLSLGIGANAAIYSFIDAIMMRALPIPNPQNLIIVNWRARGWPEVAHSQHGDGYKTSDGVAESGTFPYPAWESLRTHSETLSTLFAFASASRLNVVAGKHAFLGAGEYVSGNYFSGIGAAPAAGRLIDGTDDRAGAAGVAVISYLFSQQHFNGAVNAVGQKILLNRIPFTIVGVTAPEFYGVNPRDSLDVYVPLQSLAYLDPRTGTRDWFQESNNYWVEMMGRLRPGVSQRQAEAQMVLEFHQFAVASARNEKERSNLPQLWLEEGGSGLDSLKRQYSEPLYILIAMTCLILLIACANLANLLLSRATVRRREIAVRLSLGAERGRVVRQLLTESVLLAFLGGVMGLFVAAVGIRFLTWLLANGQDGFTFHAGIDWRVLVFTISVSVVSGIVFGLAPALQATNVDVAPTLKEARTGGGEVRHFGFSFRLSHLLIAGQIALSLLMVIAAGLFLTTLKNLHSVSLGFNTEKLLVFNLNAAQAGYEGMRGPIFYETLRQRFANMPGVRGATMTDMLLASGSNSSTSIVLPGAPPPRQDQKPSTSVVLAGPAFFDTLQIPVLLGRPIGEQDKSDGTRVVVVNERFVKKFFPGRNPVGLHFAFEHKKPIDMEIVGVAKDTRYSSLKREIPPVTYVPWSQEPPGWLIGGMYYEVRTAGDPLAQANAIRQIVRQENAQVPVADLSTQVSRIDATIAPERTFANLCSCFALLSLSIACVGLYGTMSYAVARRTYEIGIRTALGAQRGRVVWMMLREILALAAIGVALGLAVAWQTAGFVATFLYGVVVHDVFVFGLAAVVLAVCALTAGYIPAWRASRIEPLQALRHE